MKPILPQANLDKQELYLQHKNIAKFGHKKYHQISK